MRLKRRVNEVEKREIKFVPINNNRLELFKSNLAKKMPLLPNHHDPDLLYNSLFNLISGEFEKVFKPKTVSHGRTKFCEWATRGIYISRRKFYDLYYEKTYNHDPLFKQYVKKYSKTFKLACSCAKSLYLRNKIKTSTNKIRTTWNIINDETNKICEYNQNFNLKINNKDVTEDLEVASEFENFFTNIPLLTCWPLPPRTPVNNYIHWRN